MIAAMRQDDPIEETAAQTVETERVEPPVAYIPACGTLCDAFWWARKSEPLKPSD
jgi:hypothetical protein